MIVVLILSKKNFLIYFDKNVNFTREAKKRKNLTDNLPLKIEQLKIQRIILFHIRDLLFFSSHFYHVIMHLLISFFSSLKTLCLNELKFCICNLS